MSKISSTFNFKFVECVVLLRAYSLQLLSVHLFLSQVLYHSTLTESLRGARLLSTPQGFMHISRMLLKATVMMTTVFRYIFIESYGRAR